LGVKGQGTESREKGLVFEEIVLYGAAFLGKDEQGLT
jgi:hypothetical protein